MLISQFYISKMNITLGDSPRQQKSRPEASPGEKEVIIYGTYSTI